MLTKQFARRTVVKRLSILTLAGVSLVLGGASLSAQASNPLSATAGERWVARRPEMLNSLFLRALKEGNVDAIVGLFEADAQLAAQPGQPPVQGQAAIRAVVEGWLALGLEFESSSREVTPVGDLALLRGPWQARLTAPDGQTITQNGHGLEIARRQADGNWLYVLAVDGD